MSYYVTSENSVLNINNAHLKVSGNIQTDVMKLGAIEFAPPASDVPGTVNFTNVTTGVTTSSNLNVGGTLMLGTVEVVATTHTLENTTALGNVTSNTIQFTNTTTSLVASGNVEVGGNVVAGYLYGDGSNISGISSTLQTITDSGNVTSNTVQFSNAITSLTATSNIEVAGFVGNSGTGGLIIPGGTTAEQPTGATGMIRYNSTLDKYEGRVSSRWMPMTDPPPLYEFISHTFTNAGATGKQGPDFNQMKTAYNSTVWYNNSAWFNEISGKRGFQLWTVPKTGSYTIKAHGASGGDSVNTAGGPEGKGAIVEDDFTFNQGLKLVLIVGQRGVSNSGTNNAGGGGGGASWVLKENFTTSTSDVYMVAGGGGGETDPMYYSTPGSNATDGVASQASVNSTSGGAGGYFSAGGGAGWATNGTASGSQYNQNSGKNLHSDWTDGSYGSGGFGPTNSHNGGFGGGGGAGWPNGGGGGGYGGGKAATNSGSYTSGGGAGGGTSRSNGLSPSFSVSSVSEMGKIIITLNS